MFKRDNITFHSQNGWLFKVIQTSVVIWMESELISPVWASKLSDFCQGFKVLPKLVLWYLCSYLHSVYQPNMYALSIERCFNSKTPFRINSRLFGPLCPFLVVQKAAAEKKVYVGSAEKLSDLLIISDFNLWCASYIKKWFLSATPLQPQQWS